MSNQNNRIRDQSDDLTITDQIQIVGWLVKIAWGLVAIIGLIMWYHATQITLGRAPELSRGVTLNQAFDNMINPAKWYVLISLLTVGGLYCWIDHLKWRRVKQASQ